MASVVDRLKGSVEAFQALEPVSKAFLVSIPALLICFLAYHWQMFLCVLVLLLPTVRLALWWCKQGHAVVPLDYILQSFAKGFYILLILGTGCGFVAWLFASIIIYGLFEALFGNSNYLGWFWLAEALRWCTFCFVEELWKGLFVRWDRLRRQEEVGALTRAHAISGVALSLGYATSQSLLFVLLITAILENNGDAHAQATHEITGDEFGLMVFFSFFFGAVSMPLNIMGTYLTGIAINEAGEDSGECCCMGGGFDCDRCGYPPQGRAGLCAFLRILRWPIALRTALITQFIVWIVVWGLVVGSWLLAFSFMVLSVAGLYTGAYCIIKSKGGTVAAEDDVYRSVYGFQLLDDDGNAPVPRHMEDIAESGGVWRSGSSGGGGGGQGFAASSSSSSSGDQGSGSGVGGGPTMVVATAVPSSANLGGGSASSYSAPALPPPSATKESVLARFAKQPQQPQQPQQQQGSGGGGGGSANPLLVASVPATGGGGGGDGDAQGASNFEQMYDATMGATVADMRVQHKLSGGEGVAATATDNDDDDDAEEEVDIFVGGNSTYPSV